jgi:hypothetical protein
MDRERATMINSQFVFIYKLNDLIQGFGLRSVPRHTEVHHGCHASPNTDMHSVAQPDLRHALDPSHMQKLSGI